MGRRLIFCIATVLAVGFWLRPARAQSDAALPTASEANDSAGNAPQEGFTEFQQLPPDPSVQESPAKPKGVRRRTPTYGKAFGTQRRVVRKAPPIPVGAESIEASSEEATGAAATKSRQLRAAGEAPAPSKAEGETAIPNDDALDKPPAELPAVKALPPPGEMEGAPAKLDEDVVQTQAPPAAQGAAPPVDPQSPLPAAKGSTAAAPGDPAAGSDVESFVLPPDRLPKGKQSVGLTVEVIGPETLNVQQDEKLKIVVKNTGSTDALGVVVRDRLPAALELVSSQPSQEPSSGSLLVWKLGTVPAGSERLITLNVRATQVGEINHSATVSMLAGSKARTIVRQPKLKVEQVATTGKVVKGRPVEFRITVSNVGDGLARNVIVQAKLSPGLKAVADGSNELNLFELALGNLEPGQHIELDPLEADTIMGGEQTCLVVAHSPDVRPELEGSKDTKSVTVIEPKLKLKISGDDKRFTETLASYNITLENPGSAVTRNVQVVALLATSGRPQLPIPANGKWDPLQRRISWTIPQLEPGDAEKLSLGFQVLMGSGTGTFQVTAEAKSANLYDKGNFMTTIDGMPLVDLEVEQGGKRIVDVNTPITYKIKIRNTGTKEATKLLVKAFPSPNLKVQTTRGTDQEAHWDDTNKCVVFPLIPRLEAGKELNLGILVEGIKPGSGSCRVLVTHDSEEDGRIENAAYTRVTESRRR